MQIVRSVREPQQAEETQSEAPPRYEAGITGAWGSNSTSYVISISNNKTDQTKGLVETIAKNSTLSFHEKRNHKGRIKKIV